GPPGARPPPDGRAGARRSHARAERGADMSDTLNDLMREYAEEAHAYEVGAEATVAAVRRRRVRRRVGAAVAVALVVAAGGVGYALPRRTAVVTPAQTTTPTPTPT